MKTRLLWLSTAITAIASLAAAQTSASIDIDTTKTAPLNANFSGFNG